jgi:hypothetical protein
MPKRTFLPSRAILPILPATPTPNLISGNKLTQHHEAAKRKYGIGNVLRLPLSNRLKQDAAFIGSAR